MLDGLGPGVKIYGYCNGYFGRDSYGEKTIVASGSWNNENYIVAKEEGFERLSFASGFDIETAHEWLDDDTVDYG